MQHEQKSKFHSLVKRVADSFDSYAVLAREHERISHDYISLRIESNMLKQELQEANQLLEYAYQDLDTWEDWGEAMEENLYRVEDERRAAVRKLRHKNLSLYRELKQEKARNQELEKASKGEKLHQYLGELAEIWDREVRGINQAAGGDPESNLSNSSRLRVNILKERVRLLRRVELIVRQVIEEGE